MVTAEDLVSRAYNDRLTHILLLAVLLLAYIRCNFSSTAALNGCVVARRSCWEEQRLIKKDGKQQRCVRFRKSCVNVKGGCNPSTTMAAAGGCLSCHFAPNWAANVTAQETRYKEVQFQTFMHLV